MYFVDVYIYKIDSFFENKLLLGVVSNVLASHASLQKS